MFQSRIVHWSGFHSSYMAAADLRGANLRDATFDKADMHEADLRGATLSGAMFQNADLRGARVEASSLLRATVTGALVNQHTLDRGGWLAGETRTLVARGLTIEGVPGLVHGLLAGAPGLTLTFDTRLHRFDPTAFDAFIAGVLGRETAVTIEARSNVREEGPGWIRINGSDPDDLVLVAEAFYDRAWRVQAEAAATEDKALAATMSALKTFFGARLDAMRDDLRHVKASTNLFANQAVREAITDEANKRDAAKMKKATQTRLRRISEGLLLEAPKALLGTYLGESAADVAGEVVGEVAAKAIGAMTKAAVGEIAEEAQVETKKLLYGKASEDTDG